MLALFRFVHVPHYRLVNNIVLDMSSQLYVYVITTYKRTDINATGVAHCVCYIIHDIMHVN